jgi:hypothetical protein
MRAICASFPRSALFKLLFARGLLFHPFEGMAVPLAEPGGGDAKATLGKGAAARCFDMDDWAAQS